MLIHSHKYDKIIIMLIGDVFLLRIKPKHIFIPFLTLAAAYCISYALFLQAGSCINEFTVLSGENLIGGFLSGFFITVLPTAIVLLLSITVYAAPAALIALLFEGVQDGYYIFSLWHFFSTYENAATVHILLFALTRVFYSYSYLLLAVMTFAFHEGSKKKEIRAENLKFASRFTLVGGAMCVCGIFTHIILYYA